VAALGPTGRNAELARAPLSAAPSKRPHTHRALRTPLALTLLLVLVALAAPILAPASPIAQPDIVAQRSLPPSFAHLFGTDSYSRDVYARVLYGARVSLSVASLSVAIALLLGTCYGAIAAFAGGTVDRVLMRILDVLLALPRLLLLLALSSFRDEVPFTYLVILLGFTGWYGVARNVRSEIQSQLTRDYLHAARATGVPRIRMLTRHILPHLIPVLAVYASLGVAQTIALEAGLSYLGFGVRAPNPSWGTIMHDGFSVVRDQWWLTVFPGLATLLAVLVCNWLGDALRDAFAPEQVPA